MGFRFGWRGHLVRFGGVAGSSLLVIAVFAAAATGSGDRSSMVRASAARLGPPPCPVQPRTVWTGRPAAASLSGKMAESTEVHLTITPHVLRPGEIATMKVTYSGDGHCLEEQGSDCGPQGAPEASLERVDCNRPHAPIPSPTIAQLDATTQCYEPTPAAATVAPYYAIVSAPIGQCGAANGVFDCTSQDYVLVEPPCGSSFGHASDTPAWALDQPRGAAAAATGSDCPLDVTAIPRSRHITSGLATPDRGGAAFIGGGHDTCVSGCTTILVTVRDPVNHKPVGSATVDASVQPIAGEFLPERAARRGRLPVQRASADQLRRDGLSRHQRPEDRQARAGEADLRAPAVLNKASTLLTVKARKGCKPSACSTGEKTGETQPNPTITVSPNLLFQHTGTLSLEQATDLATWTQKGSPGHVVLNHGA